MEAFSLLKDLITPNSLQEKTFDELSQALEEHCDPAPSVIVEHFIFFMPWQQPSQTISVFIAHLKKTKFCEFDPTIQDMLRDLLVEYVVDDHICRRFLTEKMLNFHQATQIALVMENAGKNVHNIAACSNTTAVTQPNISHVDRGNSGRGKRKKKHVFDVTASTHWIIVTSGMQLPTSARKLATFQQPAWKGKVLRAPEIAGHIRLTEMSMTMTHTLLHQETLPQSTNSSTSHKKNWPSNGIGEDQWQMGREKKLTQVLQYH